MAKLPSPSSFLHGKQGRRPQGAGGGRFGRPGPRRRPEVRGKGARGTWDLIPRLTSARGVARRRGGAGRRRRRYWSGAAALALRRGGGGDQGGLNVE